MNLEAEAKRGLHQILLIFNHKQREGGPMLLAFVLLGFFYLYVVHFRSHH